MGIELDKSLASSVSFEPIQRAAQCSQPAQTSYIWSRG